MFSTIALTMLKLNPVAASGGAMFCANLNEPPEQHRLANIYNILAMIKHAYPLGSSFKCTTSRPLGIGCCVGQTKQAPQ
jgi:hypothetical protein